MTVGVLRDKLIEVFKDGKPRSAQDFLVATKFTKRQVCNGLLYVGEWFVALVKISENERLL
jgi:hypothetical protein